MMLPKGVKPRIIPNTVWTIHSIDHSVPVDRTRLRQWTREGRIIRVLPVAANRRVTRKKYYLLPVKEAGVFTDKWGVDRTRALRDTGGQVVRQAVRAGVEIARSGEKYNASPRNDPEGWFPQSAVGKRREHERLLNRNLTLNLGEPSAAREMVLKGVGTSAGPKNALPDGTLPFWWQAGEGFYERRFWGGARKGTLMLAARNARAMQEEADRATREGDPIVLAARRAYGAGPTLAPVALFRPEQYPVSNEHRGHLPQGASNARKVTKYSRRELLSLLREETAAKRRGDRRKKTFEGPPEVLKEHRVLGYEVEYGVRVEDLARFSPDDPNWHYLLERSGLEVSGGSIRERGKDQALPEPTVRRRLLDAFTTQYLASLHIVHNRLGGTLAHNELTRSSFSSQNTTITGHPLDLDIGPVRKRPAEVSQKELISLGDEVRMTLRDFWGKLTGGYNVRVEGYLTFPVFKADFARRLEEGMRYMQKVGRGRKFAFPRGG